MKKSEAEKKAIRRDTESRRDPDIDRSAHEAKRGKRTGPGDDRRSLTSLSRRSPEEDEFDRAVAEFHGASDRVAAIMGAALVEDNLRIAIAACLENDTDEKALFFDQGAPFGTLKAKSVAGLALGLFNKPVQRDLDVIREIRNQFAHALLSIGFDNPEIAAACGRLDGHKYHGDPGRSVSLARQQYETACWSISLAMLSEATERYKKRNSNRSLENVIVDSLVEKTGLRSTDVAIDRVIGKKRKSTD